MMMDKKTATKLRKLQEKRKIIDDQIDELFASLDEKINDTTNLETRKLYNIKIGRMQLPAYYIGLFDDDGKTTACFTEEKDTKLTFKYCDYGFYFDGKKYRGHDDKIAKITPY